MPIRRCQRIAEKKQKKTAQTSSENKTANSTTTKTENKRTEGKEKNQLDTHSSLCIACKSESPKIKRYTEEPWIQCDVCKGWWHLECACLTPESVALINKRKLYFPCALCVIKNLQCSGPITQNDCRKNDSNDKEVNCKQEVSRPEVKRSKKSVKQVSFSEQIVIIDNIQNPTSVSSTRKIEDRLKESKVDKDAVEFAYPLVRGGVAIHFKDSFQAKQHLENWPSSVFSETECVHYPKGNIRTKIGFAKNVDPRLSKQQISELFRNSGCKVKDLRRCFHRVTGRPMPVVKLFFETHKELLLTVATELNSKYNGKSTYVEVERRKKVVRCFNCMRFGHISATCQLHEQCENCGEGHSATKCTNPIKCFNCGGPHRASSSHCQTYLTKLRELQLQEMC